MILPHLNKDAVEIQIISGSLKEGNPITFSINLNTAEAYFKGERIRAKFYFSRINSDRNGSNGLYVGKEDLSPIPKPNSSNNREAIEVPLKNGSTFTLPNFTIV